ncbi:MAG: hypothetical protein JTT11_10575 [Candidatus Brockarchaeota archaeon]|nr:hypothetical protein [Candidatus Brockarchaeota archaeon]
MNLDDVIRMIQEELGYGQIKKIGWTEMIIKLEKRGIKRVDIDDALDEAERRKIINIEDGFCKWVEPSKREGEKEKTRTYFKILAEIFKDGEIKFLPPEDLKTALKKRGFDDEEIVRALAEAGRDHVIYYHSRILGSKRKLVAGYSYIPPEDRERFAKAEEADREFSDKWHEKKLSMNDY